MIALLWLMSCTEPTPSPTSTPAPSTTPIPHRAASGGDAPAVVSAAPPQPRASAPLGIGRVATPEEIAAWDIDVDPTGAALPPGRGNVEEGKALFAVWCAACHGLVGEGGIGPKLIGPEPKTGFADDPKIARTIGNYWPYATTLFDYTRRAMPQMAPGSLTDSQVYALTAFLLHANDIVPADFVADADAVRGVKMPTRVTFIPDDREETNEFR